MKTRRLLIGLMSTVALGALASAALADPSARVGRVAEIDGGVSLLPPQTDTWAWASRNYPVAPGESFWTGDDGRVQLQIGLTEARLDSETELDVVDLDYGEMRLALPQGSADIRLWGSPRGGVTIATPAGDVRLDGRGLYRIDVSAPPQDGSYPTVEVTVFEGRAEAPAPEGLEPVQAGQAAVLYAGYEPQLQDAQDAAIDDWGADLEARGGWRPTDDNIPAITGLSDLQGAGDYYQDPQYGRVWFPRDVPADWAPYRYGHWAFVEPWGYTWIDDQPWGFAPFHYGRWVDFNGHWGWVPGRATAEPVYAPALVAFIGGVGWNLGGGDAIGWVPLAPDEVYRPSYHVSDDYVRRLNVTSVRTTIINNITINNTNVTTVYRNAPAATVVRTAAFSSAQPVHRVAIPVTAAMIAQAPPARAATPPPPTAAARLGSIRPVNAGSGAALPAVAVRPPAALQAVHAAVIAAPPRAGAPPPIAGARIAPAPPRRAAGASAPLLVAPAQIHHPQPRGVSAPAPRPSAATPPSRPGFAPPPPRPSPPPAPPPPPPRPSTPPPARPEAIRPDTARPEMTRPEMTRPGTPPPPPAGDAARQAEAQAQAREAAARQAEAAAAARQAQQAEAARQAEQARAQAQAQARAAQEAEQARQAQQAQQAQQAAEQKAREAQSRAAHPAPPKKGPDGKPAKPGDAPQ